ncbi:MAG: NAD(P)-binding domain-containing protein, partial [Pseudomonadota bacterium]
MQLLELGIISAERPLVLLGCGNMGRALLSGWRAHGLPAEHIFILDPALADGVPELDIEASQVGQSVPQALRAGLVMLAIKPQVFAAAAPSSAPAVDGETAILSIMAGVPVRSLEAAFPHNAGCVRAMPNTPAAIGKGITALYAGPD